MAGMRANRTHLGTFCVPTRGFEVREQHQPLSIPIVDNNTTIFMMIMEVNLSLTLTRFYPIVRLLPLQEEVFGGVHSYYLSHQ